MRRREPRKSGRSPSGGGYSNDKQTEESLQHSIKDGVFFAVMTGGGESYFSAYAIFLQASIPLIGLLVSLPALLASTMQLFSAWLGRRLTRRKPIIVFGALLQATCLIPLALLPLYFPEHATAFLIPMVFLYLCGPNLGAPQWSSLVGDLLPESKRGRYFAHRTKLSSVASVLALAVGGLVLEGFDSAGNAYWGFVTVFILAAISRCFSAYHLHAMHEPSKKTAALKLPSDSSLWRQARRSGLVKFSAFYASMQFAVGVSGPYFTLYMLRDLQFSYFEFMLITVASVFVQFITLNRWGRLSDLFGNRVILATTGSLITVIPILWLFSTDFLWILAVQALSGLSWAGFTLSATAFVFDLTPASHRVTLFAAHNVLAAVAIFLGASLGAYIATQIPETLTFGSVSVTLLTPLYALFTISCVLRLIVAAAFLPAMKEVRRVRQMSMGGLIFRVTRMQPVTGLLFDIVGGWRNSAKQPPTEEDAPTSESEVTKADGEEREE